MDVGVLLHVTCEPSLFGSVKKIGDILGVGYHYIWLIMLGAKA
jgi:hypothetical protein